MRPNLTKDLSLVNFQAYYWLKEELQSFCRENGISSSGSKLEISNRIEIFLQTGEISKPIRKTEAVKKKIHQVNLSPDTVISADHRCSQDVRAFFKTVIPKFHFSTYMNEFHNY
ncbi:cytoplasmic protein [Oceanobacillus picturae]|uniref:Cytoplasmic protein n=1 Tax=Oceanobacillus picturae TaxID=171693 RepID=A0A0U9HCT2_9BACI|nr:cytoplasmic protein [Oceanobacillus picturae]